MSGALSDVRVLDLSRVLAGPYASMMLGDLGADVIKVERPGVGDETRQWGPPFAAPGESAYFLCANRNKRSIVIDLKRPEGVQLVKELARESDVLLENFSPGTADELGIGYDAIREVNPAIIYCSITGFGPSGPYRSRTGYDLVVSALGGLMGITGEPGGPPVKVGVAITDVCTGISAQGAICAALYARDRTGRGQRVDLSLLETQVAALVNVASSYLISGTLPRKWGAAHETIVPYQAFEAEDNYVIIACGNDQLWTRLCRLLGSPELAQDPRFRTNPLRVQHRSECIATLAPLIRRRPRDAWIEMLAAEGIPCAPISTMDEVFADPQVRARNMLVEVEHPSAGRIKLVGIPAKYSETPGEIRRPPPRLGEHTTDVLSQVLGYDTTRIQRLRDCGAIAGGEQEPVMTAPPAGAAPTGPLPRALWWVTFDRDLCSICEMCVHRCPQQALSLRREGGVTEILFDARRCDGCRGRMFCRDHCPEAAVQVTRVRLRAGLPVEPAVLVRGEVATCPDCGSHVMPVRKLETLRRDRRITPKAVQEYCPACRRRHLLDPLLAPSGAADHRPAGDGR